MFGLCRQVPQKSIEFAAWQPCEPFSIRFDDPASPPEAGIDFYLLRGVIPPGVSVPLHSRPDTEYFIVVSGGVQALRHLAQLTPRLNIFLVYRVK